MQLILRTCKKWFEKLVKWEMKYKLREVKPFWRSRLFDKSWFLKPFDEICIINGYSSTSPTIIFKFDWIDEIVEKDGKKYFKIKLWELKDIKNYN
jgi:hypothetical protein